MEKHSNLKSIWALNAIFLIIFFSIDGVSQTTVMGFVKNQNDSIISSASIIVSGSTVGTITDSNGKRCA